MERCTNHTIKVFGGNGRQYVVSVKDGMPTCTCMSFVMNRNRSKTKADQGIIPWCKHIEAQFNKLCAWRGESVIVPGKCPQCSKDTEEISE
jgi:hypothetical protein